MILSAEEAAELAGRLISEGDKALALCPLPDGRWHVGTMQPEGLRVASRVMLDHVTENELLPEGRMVYIANALYPDTGAA